MWVMLSAGNRVCPSGESTPSEVCIVPLQYNDEPLPRDHLTSVKKLLAEGGLIEVKVVLGWLLDFSSLLEKLPEDKHVTIELICRV